MLLLPSFKKLFAYLAPETEIAVKKKEAGQGGVALSLATISLEKEEMFMELQLEGQLA